MGGEMNLPPSSETDFGKSVYFFFAAFLAAGFFAGAFLAAGFLAAIFFAGAFLVTFLAGMDNPPFQSASCGR
jgi:hypothetical protein